MRVNPWNAALRYAARDWRVLQMHGKGADERPRPKGRDQGPGHYSQLVGRWPREHGKLPPRLEARTACSSCPNALGRVRVRPRIPPISL